MQPVKSVHMGSFLTTFLIFSVCMLLERYIFSSTVIVKIRDIIKDRFLGFTYGN